MDEKDIEEIFDAADTGMLAQEDFVRYSESVEALRDHEAALEYARSKAIAEGRAEGIAEGRAEGRAEGEKRGEERGRAEGERKGIIGVIRNMLNFGIPKEQIAEANNMTLEKLNLLLQQE